MTIEAQDSNRSLVQIKTDLGALRKKMKSDLGFSARRGSGLVYLLLDCSGSMYGGKIAQAKDGAVSFADDAQAKGYLVGVIAFADAARLVIEARSGGVDAHALRSLAADGSTDMTGAIEEGLSQLGQSASTKYRCLCLVSDGAPNNRSSTQAAARKAHELGINIMTLAVEGADEDFLRSLATTQELSVSTTGTNLGKALTDMSRLLPPPK